MAKIEEKKELQNRISVFCETNGISRADFAVKADVSPATLSALDNGQWDKISLSMVKKLTAFIKSTEAGNVFNTSDFQTVQDLCDTAKKHHLMIGLIGDTGTGKSTALTYYGNRKNVYRVTFEKSMNPKQFYTTLLRELGVDFEGNINALINRAAAELNAKESPLIIIDEAGKITHSVLLYLHDLREKTKAGCGIVLAGMPYFKTNLQKFASKGKEGFSEFLRRINIWHTLNGLNAAEVKYIAEKNGISDKERVKELCRIKRFGDLANEILLDKIMSNAI